MILGFSVTKQVSFRGVQQEFTNVYHYQLVGAATAPYESLLDEIRANETPFHSTDVTFVRGKCWTAGGTTTQNQMQVQKDFTGTGNQALATSMDRERAVLIRWPAGLSSNGKPVFLRKWFHCCGSFAGVNFTVNTLQQTGAISAANLTTINNAVSGLDGIGTLQDWTLCSPNGREAEGNGECHSWLEHHQLGDMWR